MPKISVVTPCYNLEKYVGKAIESVSAQTFTDWEYIVVDDGSTDNSAEVISSYTQIEPRLQLIKQQNGGMANARNSGFRASSPESKYLLFLDADDVLETQMLEVMVEYLDAHPHVGVAYCDHWNIDAEGKIFDRIYVSRMVPSRFGVRSLPYDEPHTPIESIAAGLGQGMDGRAVLRRCIYEKTMGWDEQLMRGGIAIDLFVHMGLFSDIHFVPQKLHRYRLHDPNQSHRTVNYEVQSQKILAKWKEGSFLTPEQKSRVAQLLWFYQRRLVPHVEMDTAKDFLRNKKIGAAFMLYLRAAKKYFNL
ncbi:MAG: glycosyltransferase family 2 protein [Calothrix sp. MO_167.B42]|nr:glycosyltransferase family 2 protein [Calothrix sp. MO_167.B42]